MSDIEKAPLLGKKNKVLNELKEEPVGGMPGNPMFWVYLQLAVRGAFFSALLATLVWIPATSALGMGRFKAYMPLAICIFIFTINPIFGQVLDNASAGIWGTFVACLNIFILRGFFAEGVEPGMGHFSAPSIIGWTNLLLFNFIFLSTNNRMGTRMFAMASFTGFMLAFLNPQDQTPYSKNFKINVNGTAVSSFLGVCIGAVAAIVAMCLPYPWRFASVDMKANAKKVSADTCKLFISSCTYFQGSNASVIIDQQLAQTAVLKQQLGGLGGSIGAAWNEGFDIGNAGTVRHLMEAHQTLLTNIFDILHALMIAMSTEDFGPSHKNIMQEIGAASTDLAEKTSVLLMTITEAAGDGDIAGHEKDEITSLVADVKSAMKTLSTKFDAARRKFQKPVCKELLSESFFVFGLSAYGRLVCEYAEMLCTSPPTGTSFGQAIVAGAKATFTFPSSNHSRFVGRYMLALTLCFIFGVVMDNYGGACAITAVFLLNTRVGPDMMATLNTLLAVVVGCVVGALIFQYSCMGGAGLYVLPFLAFIYWVVTIHIGYSGSSFALIGIFMAALAPFMIVKECPDPKDLSDAAAAGGLWIGIRGTIIAMIIVSLCEVCSVPGEQAKLAADAWESAVQSLEQGFKDLWENKDPKPAVDPVSGSLGEASMFNTGAKLEPRYWRCAWKSDYLDELVAIATKLRLDVLTMLLALERTKGQKDGVFSVLLKVPAISTMQKDLSGTLQDAREIAYELLTHGYGPFEGMKKLDNLEGLDELDGFDATIEKLSGLVAFPAKAPDSMEEDQLCQLSIIFVMLDYTVKHIAEMIKVSIRKA